MQIRSLLSLNILALVSGGGTVRVLEVAAIPCSEQVLHEAALALWRDGVVVLSCPAISALAPPASAAMKVLALKLQQVRDKGLDIDQPFSFAEICHRSPRRYDVSVPSGGASEFSLLVNRLVRSVLTRVERMDASDCGLHIGAAHPPGSEDEEFQTDVQDVRDGIVTSLPGADAQPLHADGRNAGVFNCFVPLVDIASDAHGPEFWLKSHLTSVPQRGDDADDSGELGTSEETRGSELIGRGDTARAERGGEMTRRALAEAASSEDGKASIKSVGVKRGGIVLFDYRILHRGRAHDGGTEVCFRRLSSSFASFASLSFRMTWLLPCSRRRPNPVPFFTVSSPQAAPVTPMHTISLLSPSLLSKGRENKTKIRPLLSVPVPVPLGGRPLLPACPAGLALARRGSTRSRRTCSRRRMNAAYNFVLWKFDESRRMNLVALMTRLCHTAVIAELLGLSWMP